MTQRVATEAERAMLRAQLGKAPLPRRVEEVPSTASVIPRTHGERQAKCPECGREYTQTLISAEWMEMAAKHDPGITQQFPDGWTPDLCGACHRELNRALAQVDRSRIERADRERAAEWRNERSRMRAPRQEALDV